MPPAPQQRPVPHTTRPLMHRLLWFIALWAGGVASVTIVGYALRLWIAPK